jgi:DNA-binding PadR family transcriptional regulator
MMELATSNSTYYKSRAGTAYSVTKRLLETGHLQPEASSDEEESHVRITDLGLQTLREWVAPPVPKEEVAYSADLLRLRFFFLEILTATDRLKFIDSNIEELKSLKKRCEALIAENEKIGDYFGALATVSIILETQARIQWLEIVRKWVENPIPDDHTWTEVILKEIS